MARAKKAAPPFLCLGCQRTGKLLLSFLPSALLAITHPHLLSWQGRCWCWPSCCHWSPFCSSPLSSPAPGRATPLSAGSWVGRSCPRLPHGGLGAGRDIHLPQCKLSYLLPSPQGSPCLSPQINAILPTQPSFGGRGQSNSSLSCLGSQDGQPHMRMGYKAGGLRPFTHFIFHCRIPAQEASRGNGGAEKTARRGGGGKVSAGSRPEKLFGLQHSFIQLIAY